MSIRHPRRAVGVALRGLLALAALTAWASAEDATFEELDALLRDERLVLLAAGPGHAEAWRPAGAEELLDGLGVDMPCGTPLASVAARVAAESGLGHARALGALVAPPPAGARRSMELGAHGVRVLHDAAAGSRHALSARDRDGDGVPDAVTALGHDVDFAVRALAVALRMDESEVVPAAGLDLHLAATAHAQGSSLDQGVIVVPVHAQGLARLAAVAHQLAHVALDSLEPELPPDVEETLATHLADEVLLSRDAEGARRFLAEERRPRTRRAWASPGILGARADAGLLAFAADAAAFGPGWLGRVLEDASDALDVATDPHRSRDEIAREVLALALDRMLGHAGTSLADVAAARQVWLAETELAALGAQVATDVRLDLDTDVTGAGRELAPFGELRFGVETPAVGGLAVAFEAERRTQATLVALLADDTIRSWPLVADPDGVARLVLPGSRLQAVLALVHAPGIPDDWSAWTEAELAGAVDGDFSLSVSARPDHPFVLEAFAAQTSPGQVTLEWTTGSEEGLIGWAVERAARAAGPWVAASALPVPAFSQPDSPGSYAFIDDRVRPDTRYHYRLRALTVSGLPEVGPSVVARTLPEGPRRRRER